MRLLAIDIGNSRVKCALFDGVEIVQTFDMAADKLASGAAYRHSFRARASELGAERAAIASVVPELNERISEAVRRELMILPEFISATNLPADLVCYDTPARLGADRIAAAVAGHMLYGIDPEGPRPVIVVDAGTAVTFEVVDPFGKYLGGAIWAGPNLVADALWSGTSLLPDVDLAPPKKVIGTDTEACLRSGILYGFLDGVSGILRRLRRRAGPQVYTISTGGYGAWLAKRIDAVQDNDPHLVLRGIRMIATGAFRHD